MSICEIFYRMMDSTALDQDISASGFRDFRTAMRESRPFQSIFLYRLRSQSRWMRKIAAIFCRPLGSLEINVTSGKIGPGFVIWHGYSTVIFCREIGKNVSINQNVTIGRGKTIDGSDIPLIKDGVKIYTGACVIGGITVGENSTIGANAVVTRDVPPNSVVAGVPAHVIGWNI